MASNLDQLHDIHDIIREHIAAVDHFYGYSLWDFDAVVESFREDEVGKEAYLQELYDNLPKEA